jgi:hypothetical protein
MKPEDVITELRACTTNQIRVEHEFRLGYLQAQLDSLNASPRQQYFQLERSALWLSLFSHINWLAHFKFLKTEKVDTQIPQWLENVFGWSHEVGEPFWYCGRNPIAHTGSQNLPYTRNVNHVKHYILLSFDNPDDWQVTGEYRALPQTSASGGSIPTQQTIFYYEPIQQRLGELTNDVCNDINRFEHPQLLKLQRVMMSLSFLADDGSLARMNNLLDVYEHVK